MAAGGALLGTSAILFGVDYRREHAGVRTTMLTLTGAF